MRRFTRSIAALAAAIAATAAAAAAPAGSPQTRDYVQAAADSNGFELSEAASALAESRDPKVRAFAQQMIRDHHRLAEDLARAAAQAGLAPPVTAVGSAQAPMLAALQSERGADFDRLYWKQQALAHRAALVTAQGYAANGDDATIRRAASAAVPVISAHLAMAERMAGPAGS